ncbi:MAG TPA: O-methyltransferase [Patescibacteria group bacterium]|nr:O-methyltransferase [Patescibacteria group bacterium]
MPRRNPRAQEEGILFPAMGRYLDRILPPRDAVLAEMEALARRDHIPIIGPACGRLLALSAQLIRARRIFEMGSAIGYSTTWLARAAGPSAKVYYTDADPQRLAQARIFLRRAGVLKRVELLLGDAIESFRRTPGKFDIIFMDIDKEQYPEALRLALPRLRRGGLLIADNVLWSGHVVRRAQAGDRTLRAVQEFNRAIYASKQLFPVIVPLRDGVAICRKG